jgi:hypothetical protein
MTRPDQRHIRARRTQQARHLLFSLLVTGLIALFSLTPLYWVFLISQ